MELAQIRTFLAVAECGSFSRAAERLFLTQPAVSKRVAQLEEELGVPLFDRMGHRVVLTGAGRLLLEEGEAILEGVEECRRRIASLDATPAGTLPLGTSHHIGLHRLPAVLERYVERHPAVRLELAFLGSEQACHQVLHGSLELAVVTLPERLEEELQAREVWPDPLAVVVSPGHPLAGRRCPPAELTRYDALLPSGGTQTRALVERALEAHGVRPRVAQQTDFLETLKRLAAIGLGWTVIPEIMVDAEVRTVEVEGIVLQRRLGVVHHRRRTLSSAARALMEMLGA